MLRLSMSDILRELLTGRVTVRVQLPVTLKPESEPEPDIAIVQPPARRYLDHHPSEEIFWLSKWQTPP